MNAILPAFKVPAPTARVFIVVALGIVIVPVTVSVFVPLNVTIVVDVLAPYVRAAQVTFVFNFNKVAESPGAMILKFPVPVPALIAADTLPKVIVEDPALKLPLFTQGPFTVSPKLVNVRVAALLIVIPAQVEAAPIVTAFEPVVAITTISVLRGTAPPNQVVFVAHAPPVAVLVTVPAFTLIETVVNRVTITITDIAFLFPITFEWNRLFFKQKDFSKILRALKPQKKYRNQ